MPFNRPTLAALNARIQRDIETKLPGADAQLRRSVERVLGAVLAGASHGLHGHLDWASKQIIVDTAGKEYLRRWARIFGLTPKSATKSTGNVTFTGTDGSVIPAATKVQRNDGIVFAVAAAATIAGGSVTTAVTAAIAGINGNTDAASPVSLVSPVAGVVTAATVATGGLANGTDAETDAELLARLLAVIQKPATGGGPGDYVNWALANAGVTRAWEFPAYLGLGTVGVMFVMDDQAGSIIPDATAVANVQAYVDARRPVTADVHVVAPVGDPLALHIAAIPNTAAVQAAITTSTADVIRRRSKPGGTIYLSDITEAISLAAGVVHFNLLSPTGDTTPSAGHIVVPGAITWS